MKYFIIAGEASGDLHGSHLIQALKKVDPGASFRCFGGDLMEKAGAHVIRHYNQLAFMGLIDVVKNTGNVMRNFSFCRKSIKVFQPDVLILIDYPAFNLRMAKFSSSLHIPVYYYISPKIWAWKESRIKTIKQYVDEMFVIFPFEIAFYKKHNFPVHFEGNPLVDKIEDKIASMPSFTAFAHEQNLGEKPVIALLPGSRKQEIEKMFPTMLSVVDNYPGYQFLVAGNSSFSQDYYHSFNPGPSVSILMDNTYEILYHARAALVTSGTATLETALIGTPQVVCYATTPFNYFIGKLFVDIRFFSLVNIIMDQEVVKELLQHNFNRRILINELDKILYNRHTIDAIRAGYEQIRSQLGEKGVSGRIAEKMVQRLTRKV